MDATAYTEMAATEERHWWFRARREILGSALAKCELPKEAQILEIGCGTGGNLNLLKGFGTVQAVELSAQARQLAFEKTGVVATEGRLPDAIPFDDEAFDLVCLFDVLEHIDDDAATLGTVRRLLRKGGRAIVTVPAYQWLWSQHDVHLHHYRRYTVRRLRDLAHGRQLTVRHTSYFNTLLFPLLAVTRVFDRVAGSTTASGAGMPTPAANNALYQIFRSERQLVTSIGLPFGSSILAVMERA